MQAISSAVIVLLAVGAAVLCNAGPVVKRQFTGGTLRDPGEVIGTCHSLQEKARNFCGYDKTFLKFPVLNNVKNIDELHMQFYDWERLLNTSCSPNLATFLCFYYFPLSNCELNETYLERNSSNIHVVRPCKETCLAATKSVQCTNLLKLSFECRDSSPWASHIKCEEMPNPDWDICKNPTIKNKPKDCLCVSKDQRIDRPYNYHNPVPADILEKAKNPDMECPTSEPPSQLVITDPEIIGNGQCYQLPEDISDFCGYSTTFIDLNSHNVGLAHDTFEELVTQFRDFDDLFNTGCSDALGPYLCSHYFPYAKCNPDQPHQPPVGNSVLPPCRETCEEAVEQCNRDLQSLTSCSISFDIESLPHLQCSQYMRYTPGDNLKCSNNRFNKTFSGEPPVRPAPVTCTPPTEKPTPALTTAKPKPVPALTTAKPTPEVCPKSCTIRTAFTGKTFLRNSYEYAVRVSVTSVSPDGRVFQANNEHNYPLQSCEDGVLQDPPSFSSTVNVKISNCVLVEVENPKDKEKTQKLTLEVGKKYLISAFEYEDDTIIVDCESGRPLVTQWKDDKRFNKNLPKWVAARTTCPY